MLHRDPFERSQAGTSKKIAEFVKDRAGLSELNPNPKCEEFRIERGRLLSRRIMSPNPQWFHALGKSCRRLFLATFAFLPLIPARGDGIPEPSLVLYGVITDSSVGARLSYGTLNWTLQPVAGGSPIQVSATLTNINDQFSYVLRIPLETEIPGLTISTGALKLASSPTTYNRGLVTVEGVAASFVQPSQTNLVLASTDRGRIERVDLVVALNGSGSLPEAWQMKYFGHTGIQPGDDPDHDGMSNYAEYRAGTDPTDDESRFEILSVTFNAGGGSKVIWSSVAGQFYTLQRSSDLLSGFSDYQAHVAATEPLNTYTDSAATGKGPFFYRVRVE